MRHSRSLASSSLNRSSVDLFVESLEERATPSAVLMHHGDLFSSGLNLGESALSATTVSPRTFGLLRSTPVDGQIYAQPLYVPGVTVNGASHDVSKQRTTLGRSRDCDVQIEDPSASRRHAEVRQEGTAYWIVDLDSTNGLEVNGMRTKRAKLQNGDRITIGSTEIAFRRDVA